MAAGATYEPIATTTLGSTATELTFSSISGAYTDLVLVCAVKPSDASFPSVLVQVNSDTATNYSETRLVGNGSTASSARRTSRENAIICDTGISTSTSTISAIIAHFQNYSNTTTYKTILSRANTADLATEAIVNLWRSTSAITSMKIYVVAGGFASGSTFSLYGIAAA